MRLSRLLAGALLVLVSGAADAALGDVLIKVDKSTQRMSVLVDGEKRYSWPVSTGLPRYSTPVGSFSAARLVKDHRSREWDNAPMPHSIFFTSRGHAIHGSDAARRLGSPASHGCIRLSRKNAAILFALVKREGRADTRIMVTGDEAIAIAQKRGEVRIAAKKQPSSKGGFHTAAKKQVPQKARVRLASRSRGAAPPRRMMAAPSYRYPSHGWFAAAQQHPTYAARPWW